MTDLIIIGGGPAGVSAALYTARAGIKTKIIYKDTGALTNAEKIDNFYGNAGISGQELIANGLTHAAEVGAEVIQGEVIKIEHELSNSNAMFQIETTDEKYTTQAVLLATGANRQSPKIPGFAAFEGKGISHCAVCDAFFYREKDAAVLGHSQYALSEAKVLLPLVKTLYVLTDGAEPEADFPPNVILHREKIRKIHGDTRLTGIEFESKDEILLIDGIFIALGTAGATALARKLGALVENNNVLTDKNMRTNIPGLWAAGDCTSGMKQIAKAVYNGAEAGMDIIRHLRVVSQ